MRNAKPVSYNNVLRAIEAGRSERSRTKRMIAKVLQAPQLTEVPLPTTPMLAGGPGESEYFKWCAWFHGQNLLTRISIGWVEEYARANDRIYVKAEAGKEVPWAAIEARARFHSKLEGVAGADRFADP